MNDKPGNLRCPLQCGREIKSETYDDGFNFHVTCPVCGRYRMSGIALRTKMFAAETPPGTNLLPYFRAYVRQASDRGEIVEITRQLDWESLALAHTGLSVQSKTMRLLEEIGRRASPPGRWYPLPPNDELAPLFDASGGEEVAYLLDALSDAELVKRAMAEDPSGAPDGDGGWTKSHMVYLMTPKGWEALMPLGGARAGTCFVAMAFDPNLDEIYSAGIQPAVEKDCGMSVTRVDKVQHNGSINDQIIVGIRTAQFVVADVTLQRNGVYFEGGYALGLGRPVIWMVREDDVKDVHFDTSHLNHIVWKDAADLRMKLSLRIKATIAGN